MDLARGGFVLVVVGIVVLAAYCLLLPSVSPAQPVALPEIPALPVREVQAVIQQAVAPAPHFLIDTNWGEVDVDVMGALDHALSRHGAIAAQFLDAARLGRCKAYLECGYTWQTLRDGVRGYFACQLAGGEVGVVPFYADGLVRRLVAMTSYPIRPGYENYVTKRDGCAPIELVLVIIRGDWADD